MVLSEAAAARDAASSMKAPTVAASSAPRMMQKPSRANCLVLGALDAATAVIDAEAPFTKQKRAFNEILTSLLTTPIVKTLNTKIAYCIWRNLKNIITK